MPVPPERQDPAVTPVPLVKQACQVFQDNLERGDHLDYPDLKDQQDHKEKMVPPVWQVCQVVLDSRELQV